MAQLMTTNLRALVGQELPPIRALITEEGVRRYRRATRRPWDGRVPWLFLTHLGAIELPEPDRVDGMSGRANVHPLPLPPHLQRTIVGGMEWEFGRRPNIGDTITISARYVSIDEREGRQSGPMLISVLELTFADQDGEWVATQRITKIHR